MLHGQSVAAGLPQKGVIITLSQRRGKTPGTAALTQFLRELNGGLRQLSLELNLPTAVLAASEHHTVKALWRTKNAHPGGADNTPIASLRPWGGMTSSQEAEEHEGGRRYEIMAQVYEIDKYHRNGIFSINDHCKIDITNLFPRTTIKPTDNSIRRIKRVGIDTYYLQVQVPNT